MPSRRTFLRTTSAALIAGTLGSRAGAQSPGKIRIGQIGTGHAHAAGKMETMRASSDYEVVGVAEPDPEQRARAEKSATSYAFCARTSWSCASMTSRFVLFSRA